jgi:hypothetical protein
MEWVATIEFTGNCEWGEGSFWTNAIKDDELNKYNNSINIGHKGERVDVPGETSFEKTENGWRYYNGG